MQSEPITNLASMADQGETEEKKEEMTEKLIHTKNARRNMKRELTGHV